MSVWNNELPYTAVFYFPFSDVYDSAIEAYKKREVLWRNSSKKVAVLSSCEGLGVFLQFPPVPSLLLGIFCQAAWCRDDWSNIPDGDRPPSHTGPCHWWTGTPTSGKLVHHTFHMWTQWGCHLAQDDIQRLHGCKFYCMDSIQLLVLWLNRILTLIPLCYTRL